MEIKWYRWVLLVAALAVGAFLLVIRLTRSSVPERIPAAPDVLKEIENPRGLGVKNAAYDATITLRIGESATFSDRLEIELLRIDDSRCPKGSACILAGELAPVISVTGARLGTRQVQVRLGETTARSKGTDGYLFTLNDASATEVSLTVTRE